MGAIFKVPVVQDVTDEQLDQFCSDEDRNIYGTPPKGPYRMSKPITIDRLFWRLATKEMACPMNFWNAVTTY